MKETLPGLMDMDQESSKELAPLTVIRTETALSRFPVHRIAKKGNVRIELKHQASALLWRVSHNSEYGQPGPLAYKLDSLVVSRRIEESGRPVPKIIRLGTLSEIAAEIGAGEKNTGSVKQALFQNAFAGITAKIKYRAVDRSEKTLEAAFTRYSVILTGETLPREDEADNETGDGGVHRAADAVHLVLNDVYREVLNSAVVRPLDYEYMKSLPPAAQRFYEIVSYQIYAALLHQNERAKLRYSEYCLLSTATRYPDFDHVKKQMYKIHAPHLQEGYLARVTFEETVDEAGQRDWFMWYTPGTNAAREYREFTQAGRRNKRSRQRNDEFTYYETLSLPLGDPDTTAPSPTPVEPNLLVQESVPSVSDITDTSHENPSKITLVAELIGAGLNRSTAAVLAAEKPDECRKQLDFLPYAPPFKSSKGAYLRRAIEQEFAAPANYIRAQEDLVERNRQQEESASRNARKAAQEARRAAERENLATTMGEMEKNAPEVFSGFLRYVESERELQEAKYTKMSPSIKTRMLADFDSSEKQYARFAKWIELREAGTLSVEFMTSDALTSHEHEHKHESKESIRSIIGSRFTETETT